MASKQADRGSALGAAKLEDDRTAAFVKLRVLKAAGGSNRAFLVQHPAIMVA